MGDIVPDRREEFSVQSIVTHDEFSDKDGSNDVAVVTLKQRFDAASPNDKGKFVTFDGIVRPLCLPETNATQFFDYCETIPFEASRPGYVTQIEQCVTPAEEEKLICAKSQSKATSPLICRDARQRLAVLAGLPTRNCHLVSWLDFVPNFMLTIRDQYLPCFAMVLHSHFKPEIMHQNLVVNLLFLFYDKTSFALLLP